MPTNHIVSMARQLEGPADLARSRDPFRIALCGIVDTVIKGFKCRETQRIWQGERSRRLPQDIQTVARRKLRYLDAANALSDLGVPPANRLEALRGDRAGQHSIRVNRRWRVCFQWEDGDASEVGLPLERTETETETMTAEGDRLPNPHPGEILLEDFLKPMQISQSELARAVGVSPRRINEVVLGKRSVTAETDLLLTRYFGLSEGLFMRLQALHDLEKARLSLRDRLFAIRPRNAA